MIPIIKNEGDKKYKTSMDINCQLLKLYSEVFSKPENVSNEYIEPFLNKINLLLLDKI